MDQQVKDLINNEITNNEVCLFMKGTPDAPQCGFSMAVSNMLKILEVNFKGVNVLDLYLNTKSRSAYRTHRYIRVTTKASFLHVAIINA